MPTQVMEYEEISSPARDEALSTASVAVCPALTLTFGGVNFCLTPQTTDSSVTFLGMGSGREAFLNLKSFTGNLRVSLTSNPPVVAETSPSPERSAIDTSDVSRGQQKLNFVNKRKSSQNKSVVKSSGNNQRSNSKGKKNDFDSTPTTANVSKISNNKKDARKRRDLVKECQQRPSISPLVVNKKRRFNQGGGDAENYDSLSADDILNKASNQTSRINSILNRMSQEPVATTNQEGASLKLTQDTTIESEGGHDDNPDEDSSSMHDDNLNEKTVDSAVENEHDKSSFYLEDEDGDEDEEGSTVISPPSSPQMNKIQIAPPKTRYPPPCPRWGHSMTQLNNNRVLVYGGQALDSDGDGKTLSDVHIFDLEKRQWFKSFNCEDATRQWPRQWHTATFLPERQLLLCFGGESIHPKTKKVTTTAKVMVLDTEIMLWYPPTVSGVVPSGRSGHTATLLRNTNELVVFGGVRGSKWLNSVSILNTMSWVWSTPQILGSAPKPRSYHTATHVSFLVPERNIMMNRIVIFGGNDSEHSFKSVHVLETDGSTWRWINPTVSGEEPLPRTGHSAILLKDKKTICIYGGWDPNAEDEEVSDENKTVNAAIDTSNIISDTIAGSDAMKDNKNKKDDDVDDVIFSDCFLLDTETWTWKRGPKAKHAGMIEADCQGQSEGMRRVGHTALLYTDVSSTTSDGETSQTQEQQQQVLLFGGRVPNDRFANDFKTLEMPY